MLVTKEIEIKITQRNIEHFTEKGYQCNLKDIIIVNTMDLTSGSHKMVETRCDFCGDIVQKPYKQYLKQTKNETIPCCCNKCRNYKAIPTWIENYGASHPSRSPEIRAKIEATCLEKYGGVSPQASQEVLEKGKRTNIERYGTEYYVQSIICNEDNIEKYGVEHWFQTDSFKDMAKKTNIEKYGVENYTQTDEYKETSSEKWDLFKQSDDFQRMLRQRENTNIKRYGVPNVSMNPEIRKKAMRSMFKNNTAPASKLQKEICEKINGVLNLPVLSYFLDIAFPNDKIYIEYDGGGHDLQVKFGKLTVEEFESKEGKRFNDLLLDGWKEVRIINSSDKRININKVSNFIDDAKDFLQEDNFSIIFNFDNNTVTFNKEHTITFEEYYKTNRELEVVQ